MTKSDSQPQVELIRATPKDQPALENLLELYAYDFSEFFPVEIGEDGRFGYPQLPLYWSEADRHAFLLRIDGKLAGFALVKKNAATSGEGTGHVWDMAEFFVLRSYRRLGAGVQMAHQIWRRFPGAWEIRVMRENTRGQNFWPRAIESFTGEIAAPIYMEHGAKRWTLYAFVSKLL